MELRHPESVETGQIHRRENRESPLRNAKPERERQMFPESVETHKSGGIRISKSSINLAKNGNNQQSSKLDIPTAAKAKSI